MKPVDYEFPLISWDERRTRIFPATFDFSLPSYFSPRKSRMMDDGSFCYGNVEKNTRFNIVYTSLLFKTKW